MTTGWDAYEVAEAGVADERDGYPARFPDDPRVFLWSSDAIAGWAAQRDAGIVGHVALHHSSSKRVMDLASQTNGEEVNNFAVVASLVVSETARRAGVGRRLLTTAVPARAGGHVPIRMLPNASRLVLLTRLALPAPQDGAQRAEGSTR